MPPILLRKKVRSMKEYPKQFSAMIFWIHPMLLPQTMKTIKFYLKQLSRLISPIMFPMKPILSISATFTMRIL